MGLECSHRSTGIRLQCACTFHPETYQLDTLTHRSCLSAGVYVHAYQGLYGSVLTGVYVHAYQGLYGSVLVVPVLFESFILCSLSRPLAMVLMLGSGTRMVRLRVNWQ